MSAWPTLTDFKQMVDLPTDSTDFDTHATLQLNAGIAFVKDQTGAWNDDVDQPDSNLSAAALRASFLFSLKVAPPAIATDPVFMSLMAGRRRRFSIA